MYLQLKSTDVHQFQFIIDMFIILSQILNEGKRVLLWCATPDGVLRARSTLPPDEFAFVESTYVEQQKHDNLQYYLDQRIKAENSEGLFAQVTIILLVTMCHSGDLLLCYMSLSVVVQRASRFVHPSLTISHF